MLQVDAVGTLHIRQRLRHTQAAMQAAAGKLQCICRLLELPTRLGPQYTLCSQGLCRQRAVGAPLTRLLSLPGRQYPLPHGS